MVVVAAAVALVLVRLLVLVGVVFVCSRVELVVVVGSCIVVADLLVVPMNQAEQRSHDERSVVSMQSYP